MRYRITTRLKRFGGGKKLAVWLSVFVFTAITIADIAYLFTDKRLILTLNK